MGAVLSTIVSAFETEEQAASYGRWFRAKVQVSLADPRATIPHDEVMARMDAIIETAKKIVSKAKKAEKPAYTQS